MTSQANAPLWTRRQYLLAEAMAEGAHWSVAVEAVASTAIEHPEWDMDEMRPWRAWSGPKPRQRTGRHRA